MHTITHLLMDERVGANGNSNKRTLPSWMLPGQKPEMHIVNVKVEKKKSNKNCTRSKRGDVDHEGEEENDDRKPTTSHLPRTRASRKASKRKLSGDDEDEEEEDQELSRLECDGKPTKSRIPKSRASGKISKIKSNGGDDDKEEGPSRLELSVRPKERKGRKKQSDNDDDVDFDIGDEISEIPSEKRGRGGRSRAARKATRAPIDTDDLGACYTDGDDDLTVEDLVSIAEEYVNEDKEEQGASSSGDDLTAEELMSIAKESVMEDTVKGKCMSNIGQVDKPKGQDVAEDNKRSLQLEEMPSRCPLKENVAIEVAGGKAAISGDPAKDMLNLFLGPLLTTPIHEEKKPDMIAQDCSFAYETQKQKQAVAPTADAVPLTKKKSSLKDKVSMFLD